MFSIFTWMLVVAGCALFILTLFTLIIEGRDMEQIPQFIFIFTTTSSFFTTIYFLFSKFSPFTSSTYWPLIFFLTLGSSVMTSIATVLILIKHVVVEKQYIHINDAYELFLTFVAIFSVLATLSIYSDLMIHGSAYNRQMKQSEYDATAAGKIQQKLNHLKQLDTKLSKKIEESSALITDYKQSIGSLQNETKSRMNKLGIHNLQQGLQDLRIRNNLALIQRRKAYILKLSEIKQRFKQALENVVYLLHKYEDSFKLAKVLSKKDLGNLTQKIDEAINTYQDAKFSFVFDETKLPLLSIDSIWKEIKNDPPN